MVYRSVAAVGATTSIHSWRWLLLFVALLTMTPVRSERLRSRNNQATEEPTARLPNFLLAGAPKAGTTALADYIFRLPGQVVCQAQRDDPPLPHWEQKELHLFDRHYDNALEYSTSLFQHCDNDVPLIMDATPEYINNAIRIHEVYQSQGATEQVKILVVLREPVSREISFFNHRMKLIDHAKRNTHLDDPGKAFLHLHLREDGSIMSFEESLEQNLIPDLTSAEPTNYSLYERWLRQYFERFPREHILVTSYDHFKTDPKDYLERMVAFLELPEDAPHEAPHSNSEHVKTMEHTIPCSIQDRLADLYAPHNQALYDLLEEYAAGAPSMERQPFTKFEYQCQS